jgi:hypothetical protein
LKLFESRLIALSKPGFDIAEEIEVARNKEQYPVNMADEGAWLTIVPP